MNVDIISLAKIMKVLGDENRFRIVRMLLEFDLCAEALSQRLGISKSAVSQHMKQLREAGLIRGEKRGYYTHYIVEREVLKKMAAKLDSLTSIPKSHCRGETGSGWPIKNKVE